MSAATIQDPADPPSARPLSLRKPAHKRLNPRPQRLHSWFNLVPIAEYEAVRPARILFLDTFVTIERKDVAGETRYRVFFEGQREMTSVVEIVSIVRPFFLVHWIRVVVTLLKGKP